MNSDVKYPDVEVYLTGTEANVYSIIARVARAIRYQYGQEAADEFSREARQQKSYDEVIQFIMGTVEVS